MGRDSGEEGMDGSGVETKRGKRKLSLCESMIKTHQIYVERAMIWKAETLI